MSFMEEVLQRNKPIWDKCIETSFIQDMKSGKLSNEDFRTYMVQDSIYLKHYARVYGMAIYRAATLREIQFYYSVLHFVTDAESAVRLDYLKRYGLTDDEIEGMVPLPENQIYIAFLTETAVRGEGYEILMAVLPCLLSYSYIFRKLEKEPESRQSPYWDFIEDYADDRYAESCREGCIFAEQKCRSLLEAEKKRVSGIFEKASFLELDFWNMVYRRKTKKEGIQ